eukprot:gnl/TRDRNA2_/TRDRNA2_187256_c0_seq1.p1 gnl/TRDRNA2_/TRDRNA2_187256_c0~~gnl/TRDRNA2_/TRDRNA2_187256_c0_seq1.p1  ORF type:complete len:530 (-),score=136.84 gnl/TRDRNA2_/TRDRNA2_187256_c0_seq1:20-1609(-)
MGDVQSQPAHVLELRVDRPFVVAPPTRDNIPSSIFARVGLVDGTRAGSTFSDANWNEATMAYLPTSTSVVKVTIHAAESQDELAKGKSILLADIRLPYAGPGGLTDLGVRPDGPALSLNLALLAKTSTKPSDLGRELKRAQDKFLPDQPHVTITVMEMAQTHQAGEATKQTASKKGGRRQQQLTQQLPPRPEQLQQQPQQRNDSAGMANSNEADMMDLENEDLRKECLAARQQISFIKEFISKEAKTEQVTSTLQMPGEGLDWERSLKDLQAELESCKERQAKMRMNYEDRVSTLQIQVEQAKIEVEDAEAQVAAVPVMSSLGGRGSLSDRIDRIEAFRVDLLERWREVQQQLGDHKAPNGSAAALSDEIKDLTERSDYYQREMAEICAALEEEQEQDDIWERQHQEELGKTLVQVAEQLDELNRVRDSAPDEEAPSTEDSDRLANMVMELQKIQMEAKALRNKKLAEGSDGPLFVEVQMLRAERDKWAKEVEEMRATEAVCYQTVQDLEQQASILSQMAARAATEPEP